MREPTVVATTMAITVATALATSRVWTAISISPDVTVFKLLKSETYRDPDDADRLRRLLIEAGLPECSISTRRNVRYLALSGHELVHCACPLSGVKHTRRFALHMSAFDPKRTSKLTRDRSRIRDGSARSCRALCGRVQQRSPRNRPRPKVERWSSSTAGLERTTIG